MKMTNCQICGKEIRAIGNMRKYCAACRKIRDNELQQQRSTKKRQEEIKGLKCVANPNKGTLCV